MWEVIDLESNFRRPDFMLPVVAPEDEKIINELKKRVSLILWYRYIEEMIFLCKKWKRLVTDENIIKWNLPFNLEVHLSKTTNNERLRLLKTISDSLKDDIPKKSKEQLFYLRSKILLLIQW